MGKPGVSKLIDDVHAAAVAIRLDPPEPGASVWGEWAQEHLSDGVEAYQHALARALVTCRVGRFHLGQPTYPLMNHLQKWGLLPHDWWAEVWVLVDEQRDLRQKNLVEWLGQKKSERREEWTPATSPAPPARP